MRTGFGREVLKPISLIGFRPVSLIEIRLGRADFFDRTRAVFFDRNLIFLSKNPVPFPVPVDAGSYFEDRIPSGGFDAHFFDRNSAGIL